MTDNEALALKIAVGLILVGGAGAGAYYLWKRSQPRALPDMNRATPPLGVDPEASPTSTQQLPDGTVQKVWSDGSQTTERTDGTVQATSSTGATVTQRTDGTVEARTATGQTTAPPRRESVSSEGLKGDPGQAFFGRITSGPTFDACSSGGRVWDRARGCTDEYYEPQHRDIRHVMVTDGELIREAQRKLRDSGFYNRPDGSPPLNVNVVDGSVGPATSEALVRFQQWFNMARGFRPENNYTPDGSETQSRTAYLPVTGTLDYLTYLALHQE